MRHMNARHGEKKMNEKVKWQWHRADGTKRTLHVLSKSVFLYDLRRWQLLEENNSKESTQFPDIPSDPG